MWWSEVWGLHTPVVWLPSRAGGWEKELAIWLGSGMLCLPAACLHPRIKGNISWVWGRIGPGGIEYVWGV